MLLRPLLISPCAAFWPQTARALLDAHPRDLAKLRIVVPTLAHVQHLKAALAFKQERALIAPRIHTMSTWLGLQVPLQTAEADQPGAASQRLMSLYGQLRQHAWLKKLFSARGNTDLLPLAQILLTLSDELSQALLPAIFAAPEAAEQRWQVALEQLSPPARQLLSDESQLVWSIWKSQLDGNDPNAVCYTQMLGLADNADRRLIWINPEAPAALEGAFLAAYAQKQDVWQIGLDWRASALPALFVRAWPELIAAAAPEDQTAPDRPSSAVAEMPTPVLPRLCAAASLEDEAQRGAQTIIDWLQTGVRRIAIIAQDRVVARRIRALLERAQVLVADETGWKLSTTRSAAALAAWFEVVATRAETIALLDLLKSPFLFAAIPGKSERVMEIERTLLRANVLGGWEAAAAALDGKPLARELLITLQRQANLFGGRKTMREWIALTRRVMTELGLYDALAQDAVGAQVLAMLEALEQDCAAMADGFNFAEWRACVSLHLEATQFIPEHSDTRVVMLALNGIRLRGFDAVLMVGCDADHLPSRPQETLFFANAVRRELGLATRESLQAQQMRNFTEVLCSKANIVLSWQAHKEGEANSPSAWIERIQLALERSGAQTMQRHDIRIAEQSLTPQLAVMPAPGAAQLAPAKLSASGYNKLFACPYQFFAGNMLRLASLEELSDMPEKRDYGGWLHDILQKYHEALATDPEQNREQLIRLVSARVFEKELKKNAAALGYYARWQKVIPAYLEWAAAREAQGWHFAHGEEKYERSLKWDGCQVVLHGRVDRIDQNMQGQYAVLDYKTSNQSILRAKLRSGEDHQLPFYGLLLEGGATGVAAANYVALELIKDKTGDVEAPDFAIWQHALERHIKDNLSAIKQGAGLPANGIESVCQYCEVRGLCRKGAW